MQIFKLLLFSFFLILSFTFSGCQGNNSDAPVDNTNPDENTTLPPIDINATTDTKKLAIVNGNVITVTGSGSTKDIFIMAFNSSNSTNTEGSITFQYPVEFINNNVFYGSMDPGTATIVDGRVHFVYTAPNDITDINGTRVEFRFYDTKNADANVSLYIDFNLTGDYVSTDPVLKTLTLSDANLTINSSSQVENLILQAYTDQSTTDIDVELNIKYPQDILDNNINIGILPATLDVQKGIVTFNYQGVPDIEATIAALNAKGIANPIKVNIYDAKTGANVDLNLNFETPPAVDPKYNNYELNIFPENNISIIANEQEVVLEVFLENNSTGLPVASESVFIEFFDSSEGTINSFSGLTDVNGHIVFNYKAPADITASDDFNMTFKLRGDINNVKYRPVSFNLNGTTKDYTGYSLSTIPKNANITRPLQEKIIDVYVENNSSRPAEGETLLVKYFSGSNGTMDKFSAVTDENGHASFIYTAPETLLADGSDYNVTISINGTDLPSDISFTVLQDTTGVLHEISLLPDTIKVLKSDQNNIIKILTLDANRIGVSTEIVIEQPSKDGIDYGSFNTLKLTTNEDGYADVNFTSPANIDNLDNRTILFRDINTLQEHNLTISYEKSLNLNSDLYEIGLTQDDDIAVESSGQAYLSIFKSKTPTELIKSWYVYDVNVTTRYGDKIYFDANDKNADSITFQQTAEQGFSIYTKQQASVVVLDVTANIFDGENNVTITNSFPVVINSGELSSISMFFASTENDPVLNTYTDYYTVHAVDKFGNPVNTGTVIHPTLVNGIKHSSLTDVNGTGELVSGANATFADATQNFSDVEASSDRLIVLASQNQTNKYFFGNWEIESVGVDLNLTDELDDNSSISLKYVIGNEKRVFTNNGTDSIAVANVQAIDGVYETDANGNLRFKVVYDPALRGEKVYIAANAETSSGKIGIAIEAVLAYTGKRLVLSNNAFSITNAGESVSIDTTLYDEAHNVISATPSIAVVDFNTSIGSYEISGLNHNLLVYTAPEKLADLKTLKGTTHTFRIALEATENIYETVTVTFPADNNYTGYSLKVIPNDFIVKKENDSKEFKVYILDANGDIIVNEQLVADFFDTKKGSMADYYAISTSYFTNYATFTYIAPDNISGLENTAFDFNITMQNDKNITAPVKVNFIQRVDDINYTNYDITTLDSNITIRSGLESHVIDIYLQGDENRPAENETILLDFFNGSVGSISSFSAITDSTGHATFNYTSPSDLSTIDNNSTILTFKMDNNQQKDVNITLLVDTTVVSDPKYDNYVLSVYPESNVSITANLQESVLEVYLEDNTTNLPVANEGVVIEFFDVSKGSMNAFSGTTDVNGQVLFNYIAPADITGLADLNITFKLLENVQTTNFTTILFDSNAPQKDYSDFTLTLVDVNRTITAVSQTEIFNLYLEDNTTGTLQAAVGDIVTVDYFNGTLGTLASFSGVTDDVGHVQFTYTAPENLTDLNGTVITFRVKNTTAAQNKAEALISVDTNSPQQIIAKLAINEVNTTISQDLQLHTIIINALDANNNFVTDGTINVTFPNVIADGTDVGTFTSFSVAVVNGRATFNYTGPTSVQDTNAIVGNGALTFEFNDALGNGTPVSWNVTFNPDVPVIRLAVNTITLTQNDETVSVQVLAFDENNQSLDSGTISVAYPTEIINSGVNGGRFLENEATITSGEALFTFQGPLVLENINALVFTFSYKGNSLVTSKDLTVNYSPPTAAIYLNETTKEVTLNSETINIEVDVRDANNNPFPTGSVKIVYPNDVQTGRDIGSFLTSEIALLDGKASFVYTAPKNLDSNTSDIVFGFYHDSLPTNIKNFTVTLNPEPNQVILTDYFLTNSYADGSISMDLESTKLITFYIKDKDGTLLEDSNITSIDVTLLNTSLADLADTNASSTPSDSKTLTKNSSSLSVLSNTTSGVVPIKVFAQFKGVNNEDVNLTEIFNVVIVSGPPTSMSISYVSTTNDDVNARFIEKMIVAITDKYSNRVDSKPGISVALIAGYASDTSGPLDYMYHTYGATIDASDDKIKVESGKVMKATITSSGSDYDIAPTVTLGGGDGDFAATAYLSTFGGVSSVNMIRGGAEYISEPVVTAKGSGSGFAATAVLANTGSFFTDTVSISTGLEILNLDNAGSGYTSVPTVSAAGGNGDFDALAVLSSTGSIKSLSIDTAGSGYSAGDVLPVDGDGTGGSVKVKTVDGGGAITELVILDGGSGYTSVSVDTLTTGNQDASVSATLGFSLKEVQLRDGGTGYSDETLTVAGGSPTVNAQVSGRIGYSVASVTVTAIGSGFRSATIGFDGGKTDGSTSEEAVASATIKYPVSFIEITNGGTGYADGALTITAVGTGSGAAANAEVFADFSTVTENSGTNDDYLMTFGDGYAYNASGKWDITSSGANDEFERVLTDQFDGNTTTRLGFAIGNNQRQDVCLSGKEWVATANTPALEFNENGLAEIEITYDYYLAAKDVVVSANLVGVQNSIGEAVKLGEATKHTLRGTGLIADTLELPSGLDHAIYRIQVELDGAPNTFRNSNFNYTVSSASLGLTIHNVHDSMDDGIHECPSFNDEGRAYVELEVSTTLPSTVTLDNLVISREFK